MAAEQQSAMINKAYETLREPLQRAHLLVSVLCFQSRFSLAPSLRSALLIKIFDGPCSWRSTTFQCPRNRTRLRTQRC